MGCGNSSSGRGVNDGVIKKENLVGENEGKFEVRYQLIANLGHGTYLY